MSDITATLWFLLFATVAGGDVFYFNDELDGFFSEFREDIKQSDNYQFPLPNVNFKYNKDLLFTSIHGEMNGTEGTIQDLSTIKRTNNVTIVTAKEYFVFRAEFGLEDLRIFYKYKGKFLGLPLKGNLFLTVGNNSIYVELLVNLTENRCSGNIVTIRNLKFTTLENISVDVTGFSILNSLAGYLLTHSVNDVSTSVTEPIENGLRKLFKDNFKEFDFCKFGSIPENIPFDDMDSSDDVSNTSVDLSTNTSKEINAVLN